MTMKDKIWAWIWKRIYSYELFKYFRAHKYENKLTEYNKFNKGL